MILKLPKQIPRNLMTPNLLYGCFLKCGGTPGHHPFSGKKNLVNHLVGLPPLMEISLENGISKGTEWCEIPHFKPSQPGVPPLNIRLRPGEAGRPQGHGELRVVQAPEAARAVGGALHGEGQEPAVHPAKEGGKEGWMNGLLYVVMACYIGYNRFL